MNAKRPTAHIVNNFEVGTTECGLMLLVEPELLVGGMNRVWQEGPFPMSYGDVAIWDNENYPAGTLVCHECTKAYNN